MSYGNQASETIRKTAATAQIITVALLMGVVNIGAILGFLKYSNEEGIKFTSNLDKFAMLALAIAVAGLIASFVVPPVVSQVNLRKLLESGDASHQEHKICGLFTSQLIMQMAFLEGPIILCLVLFFSVSNSIYLPVTAGVLAVFLAAKFPATWKVQNWVEEKKRELER